MTSVTPTPVTPTPVTPTPVTPTPCDAVQGHTVSSDYAVEEHGISQTTSAEACSEKCGNFPADCNSFVYWPNYKRCYLKTIESVNNKAVVKRDGACLYIKKKSKSGAVKSKSTPGPVPG